MACFLVTAAEAAVVTVAAHSLELKEMKQAEKLHINTERRSSHLGEQTVIPWSRKLKWLSWLLWGGALLLAYEHVWHGEVVPWFPFLTAMNDPGDTAEMLHEMATIGVTMAGIVTGVWVAMCLAADAIVKRSPKATTEKVPV